MYIMYFRNQIPWDSLKAVSYLSPSYVKILTDKEPRLFQ